MVQNLKPNGLRRKTTYVSFDQLLVPTNADFGGPVNTDFDRAPIHIQVDASVSPFGHQAKVDTN